MSSWNIPLPPKEITYRNEADGISICFAGDDKFFATAKVVLVFGGTLALFAVILYRDWANTPMRVRMICAAAAPLWLLLGAIWGIISAAPIEYRVHGGGVLTSRTRGFFRWVVRRWSSEEILQITADFHEVNILFQRQGRWIRSELSVREDTSDARLPDEQAGDRARWLADVLVHKLQIPPMPDTYEAPPLPASPPGTLSYAVAGGHPPAITLLKNTRGEVTMRVEPCRVWGRNWVQFVVPTLLSLFAIYIAIDTHGQATTLIVAIPALVSWAYMVWASRSSTLLRVRDGAVTVYRRTPLGLTKGPALTPDRVRELVIRRGMNLVAADVDGYDVQILAEADEPTQQAVLKFIRDALWPGRATEPVAVAATAVRPVAPKLDDFEQPPIRFHVRDGGWEIIRERGGWKQVLRIAITFAVVAAFSFAWLHFHPWGRISAIIVVTCVWLMILALLQGAIAGLFAPVRIKFDGESIVRTRPTFMGLARHQWQRWQISELHIVSNSGENPKAAIRLRLRSGGVRFLLWSPEQPLRRVAGLIAASLGMEPNTTRA